MLSILSYLRSGNYIEAIIAILRHVELNDWIWVSSSVVLFEVNQTPNLERKHRLLKVCDQASHVVKLDEEIYAISEDLKKIGFKSYDSLHLACAQKASVDIFLSTDNSLIKRAAQNITLVGGKAANPLAWLQEIL